MQQNSAQTGPIMQYPLHQPRPIQSWFRTHCNAQPRIPEKPARPGMSPLRLRNFGRKTGVTGPIVKQLAPVQSKFVVVEPDLTAEPVTPLPSLSPEPITPDWLIADIPPIEDECETVEREEPELYKLQLLARKAQREQKGH